MSRRGLPLPLFLSYPTGSTWKGKLTRGIKRFSSGSSVSHRFRLITTFYTVSFAADIQGGSRRWNRYIGSHWKSRDTILYSRQCECYVVIRLLLVDEDDYAGRADNKQHEVANNNLKKSEWISLTCSSPCYYHDEATTTSWKDRYSIRYTKQQELKPRSIEEEITYIIMRHHCLVMIIGFVHLWSIQTWRDYL